MSLAPLRQPAHRGAGAAWVALAALAAGPAAWIVQLVASYGLASRACSPGAAAGLVSPPPGWAHEPAWLTLVNLTCLAAALVGGAAVSWRNFRRAGALSRDPQSAAAIGQGRARFIAGCGVMAGVGFAIAIAFDTLEPHLLAACWRMAP